MTASICGADCAACPFRSGCAGCRETGGRPFGRDCPLASCCRERGQEGCDMCGGVCGLRAPLIAEFQALGIPELAEVTDLHPLAGSFINLPCALPSGETVRLLEDEKIYLGNQIEKRDGGRCYGLAGDGTFLVVFAYGEGGSDPELILYKKRK